MKNRRRHSAALFGLVASVAMPVHATGGPPDLIREGNIQTYIRPVVTIGYSGTTATGGASQNTAVGILDTGDVLDTFSRETANFLGIGLAGPRTWGATAPQTITSGGVLGAWLDPAERVTQAAGGFGVVRAGDPAHVFSFADVTRTSTIASDNIRALVFDYNGVNDGASPIVGNRWGGYSENHNSMAFLTRADPGNDLVAFVDPINASPIPFAYDNSRPGAGGGNGRNLGTAAPFLDNYASSVSYFQNNDERVPDSTPGGRNENPGFVHFVDLKAMEFATSMLTPAPGDAIINPALTEDRRLTITIPDAQAANYDHMEVRNFESSGTPIYLPADVNGNVLPFNAKTFEVRNAGIRIGGQQNPNGFERRDGSVRVIVKQADGTGVVDQNIALPSQAPQTWGVIDIPELGLYTGPNDILIDTGAPETTTFTIRSDPNPASHIIGTDILNRFGQFYDLSNQRLVLIGPSSQRVRDLRDNGIVFNVDTNTAGMSRTGVRQEAVFGAIPQLQNDAATVDIGGATPAANPSEAAATTFRTHLTGSNASYIDEAAMGLPRGEGFVINAQSLGQDFIDRANRTFFSVDEQSIGLPESAVQHQKLRNQSQSDIFETVFGQSDPARIIDPVNNRNALVINQEVMGLGNNVGPAATAIVISQDNLNGFDLDTGEALPANSLSNLDSPIVKKDDTGTADRPRVGDERYATNFDSYFSLEGVQDIFQSEVAAKLADGFIDIGLSAALLDDIDALALSRVSSGPLQRGMAGLSPDLELNPANGQNTFDRNLDAAFLGIDMFLGGPQTDLALFSLARGSDTLAALGLSPADVFITDFDGTFTLFASAESMGLDFWDNIDGLDSAVPLPSSVWLMLSGIAGLGVMARRKSDSRSG